MPNENRRGKTCVVMQKTKILHFWGLKASGKLADWKKNNTFTAVMKITAGFFKSQQRSKLINNHLIKIIYEKKIPIFCNIDAVIGSMRIHSMWR